MTSKGEYYPRVRFKQIIQEQVMLGYLTKGGVTYGDTENMTPYERKLAIEAMKEVIDTQNKELEAQAARQSSANNKYSGDPKSGLTSRKH